ncbi:hypothetical protein DITRI_Ditri07aG0106700 [Diplodiscus trichospermus]
MARRNCSSSVYLVACSWHCFIWWSWSLHLLASMCYTVLVNFAFPGSVKISKEKDVVQIPIESDAFNMRHQVGIAIYFSSFRLFDPYTSTVASFQTTFALQFSNSSKASIEMPNNGGSGLTFIIVPNKFTMGRSVGPWLGMLNDAFQEDYKVVAVEFDTH